MTPVVVVENVSKRYMFQTYRPSLRHELGQMIARLFRRSTQAPVIRQAGYTDPKGPTGASLSKPAVAV